MRLTSITGKEVEIDDDLRYGACVPLQTFEYLNQLGEGTYGVVYRARDKRNDAIVALKTIRIFESEKGEGIPITALREISILRSLKHLNVINVLEVAVGHEMDEIFMVEEYAEQDMANILDTVQVKFTASEGVFHHSPDKIAHELVKCLAGQLFEGLQYRIIHRDLKMSNLLLTKHGVLKIADFGMAREKAGWMTPQPVTIWYRAPELLFGSKSYSYSVDLWSAGCIMAELITSQPLLPGSNEKEEMDLIVCLIDPPSETTWPGFKRLPWANQYTAPDTRRRREGLRQMFQAEKPGLIDILRELLVYNPESRLTAREALSHRYFRESPAAQDARLLPTFPEMRNETDSRRHKKANAEGDLVFDDAELRARLGEPRKKRRLLETDQ